MYSDWLAGLVDLSFIPDVLVKTSVFAAAAWLAHFMLRGRNSRWRAIEWRGVCVGLFLLPLLIACLPSARLSFSFLRAESEAKSAVVAPAFLMASGNSGMGSDFEGNSPGAWLASSASESIRPTVPVRDEAISRFYPYLAFLLIWIVGFTLLVIRVLIVHKRLSRTIRSSESAPESVLRIFERVATDMACSGRARLICSSEIGTPLLAGTRAPLVMLPTGMTRPERAGDLSGIFAHELSHLRSRDILWERLLQALTAVYWFHPLVWGMRPAHAGACEEVCDAEAAEYVGDREAYSGILARVVLGALGRRWDLAGAPMAREPEIRLRLKRLKQRIRFSPPRPWHVATVGLLGTLVLVSVGAVKLTAQPGDASFSLSNSPSAVASPFVSPDETPPSETPPGGGRILRIPKSRLIVSTMDESIVREIKSFFYWDDGTRWKTQEAVSGEFKIPPGKRVNVYVSSKDGFVSTVDKDLSVLGSLRPDDLHSLTIPVKISERSAQHIAKLKGLKVLEVRQPISVASMKTLTNLTNLERFTLPPGITEEHLTHIGRMTSLKALYVKGNRLSEAGLARLKNLTNLKELELGGGNPSAGVLRGLAQFPSLEFLSLNAKGLDDRSMANLKSLASLKILCVSGFPMGNAGVGHLADLPNLERLQIHNAKISDDGIAHLKKLKSLKMFDMTNKQNEIDGGRLIGDEAMAHLKQIRTLEYLSMFNFHFTDEGLIHLSELSNLKALRLPTGSLLKGDNYFYTDKGIEAISRVKTLEELLLGSSVITNKSLSYIAKLPRLNNLSVSRGNITISGVNHLNALRELHKLNIDSVRKDDAVLDLSGLTKLEELSLRAKEGSWILDEDFACLAGLTRLRWIQATYGLSDNGLAHVSKLTNLQRLSVAGPAITDKGLVHLAGLKNLEILALGGSITGDGFHHLEGLKKLFNFSIHAYCRTSESASRRLSAQLPRLDSIHIYKMGLPNIIPPN